jgi:uncharacterized membrane protein YdjX (TVP38/TMEM64 family)
MTHKQSLCLEKLKWGGEMPNTRRWLLFWGFIIIALILIPFLLFGAQIETWTDDFTSAHHRQAWIALVLGSLLALDILIPTPSSLVGTAAGFMLGFIEGTLVSWAGMTISCIIGYWVGVKFGRAAAQRLVGNSELERLEDLSQRFGDWVVIISRPVPMLAEASVLFAGISDMPRYRFLLLSTLSNLGISAVYAATGAFSATVNSFLLAFGAAVLLPALAMFLARKRNKPQRKKEGQ